MAKVYEALKRAEEERKRRAGDTTSPVAPLDVPPTAAASEAEHEPIRKRVKAGRRQRSRETVAEVNKRRISLLQPDSYVAEQFRALRGRIDAIASQRPIRTLLVSSPLAGEGKTTAAINLAAVISMGVGRRVLLVDCDMRKPRIHQALGLRPEAGLAEVLTEQVSLDQAVVKVEAMNLEVLAVRGRPSNPSELLSSPRMRELMDEMASRYERVILDTPAALGVPDAKAVAELCDGVVVVVRADVTAQQDVEAALEILDRRRVLGLVLNGARVEQGRYGYTS
jgi:capsular exopolysaccharide synthesis family protein